ncbi:MAG: hypothetical protein RIR11_2593 [Bacteroidota bacterium]|jgi:hypothetical protein
MKKYLQAALILGFLEFIILYLSNNSGVEKVRLIGLFYICLLLTIFSIILYILDQRSRLGSAFRFVISLILYPIISVIWFSQWNTFDE